MGRYCCVYGCLNSGVRNPELTFFHLPSESERCLQFLRLIDREDLLNSSSVRSYEICEIHFKPEDIKVNEKRKLLRKNCLPCLHLPKGIKEDKQTQTEEAKHIQTIEDKHIQVVKIISPENINPTKEDKQAETIRIISSYNINPTIKDEPTETIGVISSDNINSTIEDNTTETIRITSSDYINPTIDDKPTETIRIISSDNINPTIKDEPTETIGVLSSDNINSTIEDYTTETIRIISSDNNNSTIEDYTETIGVLSSDNINSTIEDYTTETIRIISSDNNNSTIEDYTETIRIISSDYINLIKEDKLTETDRIANSDNINQTSVSHSADTPCKRKLGSELSGCEKRLRLITNQENTEKSQRDIFNELCDRFLSKDLSEIVKAQYYLKTSHKGMIRYRLAYKMFCLNLYYASPQAYRLLEKLLCLPCRSTLIKPYIPMSTEVNDKFMTTLKIKVENMSDREKNCTIVVDAMSLKTNFFHDILKDKIIGFHEVDGEQSPSLSKYALVVLIRGIFVNWYQPVGYALLSEYKSELNISQWMDKLILKLIEIGLQIRGFVSHLGSDLFNAHNERGISVEKTYFTINNHKIYYIFDALHLIKLIRNNFMTYNFHFQNGSVAKFEHIVKFYEYDKNKDFKGHKLADSHIAPTNLEKKEVRYAAQLLSRSVAASLSTCIDFKLIEESARDTVIFLKLMNDLFDVLNSSTLRHIYSYKSAFCGDDSQIEFLNNVLKFFHTLKLIHSKDGNDGTKKFKFIQGFVITIKSILSLFEDLKQEGHQYLLTRRLNQDVMENFFGKIRYENGNATKPTSKQFVYAYRKLFFANIVKPPKERSSADDLTDFLVHFSNFKNSNVYENADDDILDYGDDPQENDVLEITSGD